MLPDRRQEGVQHPQAGIVADDPRWFRLVADYTNDWESWHGPDGKLLWVNPAVERATGYTVAECLAMGDYPMPMIALGDRAAVQSVIDSVQNHTSGEGVEFQCIARCGDRRHMSLSWQPMYDASGRHLGLRTSVRDVTERKMLRDQLKLHADHLEQLVQERTERLWQLERRQREMERLVALGELAAGVAHEINNPLAGVRNAFELIKSSLPPDNEHFELLGLIDKEIERISGITHQMYQLYRRAPQRPADFAIVQTVRDVIRMLDHSASKKGIRLRLDAADDSPVVTLVEGEVKQVLYNVMRNAIQASEPGHEVRIDVLVEPSIVRVRVRDDGPGISPDVLPRIFDPFFTTKHGVSEPGMGLGLSVSRSLIESMGGRIEVTSTPGAGSAFAVILPRTSRTLEEASHD